MLPQSGDRIAGKYVVQTMIGRGGMGAVFRARNELTGRRVALKWILSLDDDADLKARLLREARAMGRIEHPNVCAVLDVGQTPEATFLVMEYLEGKTLRGLCEGRKLEPDEAISLLLPAMSGVAAAHQAGVIHRDLKPDNLFVCVDKAGAPVDTKVLDFGVSKIADPRAADEKRLTKTGQSVGTPSYMAPEQVRGAADLDHRLDIYALGVILYELLTERLPYEAATFNALIVRIATSEPTPIREHRDDLPAELQAAIDRAIAPEREDRWQDVVSFARALEPFAPGKHFRAPHSRHSDRPDPMSGSEREDASRAETRPAIGIDTGPLDGVEGDPPPVAIAASSGTKLGAGASAADISVAIDVVDASGPSTSRAVSSAKILAPPPRRGWLPWALAAGLVLAIAAGFSMFGGAGAEEGEGRVAASPTPTAPPVPDVVVPAVVPEPSPPVALEIVAPEIRAAEAPAPEAAPPEVAATGRRSGVRRPSVTPSAETPPTAATDRPDAGRGSRAVSGRSGVISADDF